MYSLSSWLITVIHQHDAKMKISPHFNLLLDMEMGGWSIILVLRGKVHSILPVFPNMWSQEGITS